MRLVMPPILLLILLSLQAFTENVYAFASFPRNQKLKFGLQKETYSLHSLSATKPRTISAAGNDDIKVEEGSKELSRRDILSTAAFSAAATFTTTASGLIIPKSVANASTETDAVGASTATGTSAKIPTIKLGGKDSTLEVSRTIQGYWQLAGGHGRYKPEDALENMKAHFDAGITTLDTADIYGASEGIVGKYMKANPQAIPCTKFCCFKFLDEIDKTEVRTRIEKVRIFINLANTPLLFCIHICIWE